jgi:hypothetical protein
MRKTFQQEGCISTMLGRDEPREALRRAAAYLQGNDTRYFSDPGKLEAIRTLYRIADSFV